LLLGLAKSANCNSIKLIYETLIDADTSV